MRVIYGKIGEPAQQVGGTHPGDGWTKMAEERPGPDYVAQADGTWGRPLPQLIQTRWDALRADNSTHIYSVYDEGTQSTLNALGTQALNDGNQAAITELRRALDWIGTSLGYYYQAKAQLMAAQTVAEVEAVTWDFSAAVPPPADPVRIDAVMSMLGGGA